MLCRWLRGYANQWLTPELASSLGVKIRQTLLDCRSAFDIEQIHHALKDQFLADEARPVRDALLAGLAPGKIAYRHHLRRDMSIGLLADIHANLPALEAVLEEMDRRDVRQLLVLGDVVGYGPDPEACIRLLQERNARVIRGNHDHYVGNGGHGRVAMSQSARWAAQWTMQRLSGEQLEWLGHLPLTLEDGDMLAVHGAPVDRTFFNSYVYDMTSERNLLCMLERGLRFCMHGHSHLPGVYAVRKPQCYLPLCTDSHQDLTGFDACLISPGSVGQPRTGMPGADAAVFDPVNNALELIHIEYDMRALVGRMRDWGFPGQLISRLENGR